MAAPSLAQVDRFVELAAGARPTQAEAARILGVSTRTVERWMARPDVRARVEELREKPHDPLRDALPVIEELVHANRPSGEPDWSARARGTELMLRYQDALEAHAEGERQDASPLPEGCFVVVPGRA